MTDLDQQALIELLTRQRDEAEARLTQIRDLCNDAGYVGLPSNLVALITSVLGPDRIGGAW